MPINIPSPEICFLQDDFLHVSTEKSAHKSYLEYYSEGFLGKNGHILIIF